MSDKSTFAKNWLLPDRPEFSQETNSFDQDLESHRKSVTRHCLPDFTPNKTIQSSSSHQLNQNFNPVKHFISGWSGEALTSKELNLFSRIFDKLSLRIKKNFIEQKHFHKSLKQQIFQDFTSFIQATDCVDIECDNVQQFWSYLNENDDIPSSIEQYIDIYSKRICAIYTLKLRFSKTLVATGQVNGAKVNLLNSNQLINHIFRKGGTYELHSKAFNKNAYSWWRPQEDLRDDLEEVFELLSDLSVTQVIRCISQKTQLSGQSARHYSHSLSHKNFGLFINSLLLNFPLWLQSFESNELNPYGSKPQQNILSCKFIGDYLESLSQSHWLAQENNKYFKWDDILCGEFKGLDFESGSFFAIVNELLFMAFLSELSRQHGFDPVQFIENTLNNNYRNKKEMQSKQTSLFDLNLDERMSTYNRIVCNIANFPKSNPGHYLIQKITDQIDRLKDNGFLYVLSDKKLFVNSLKDKIEGLLSQLKIEAAFDLDQIKGKGEVPSYIYIFRKDKNNTKYSKNKSQECFTFRFSGVLESFHHFHNFTDNLQQFFRNHLGDAPALATMDFGENNTIEFYRDAIIGGRLIRSSNKDSNKITHPKFFKKLVKNSITFDNFFEVEPLDNKKSTSQNKFDGLMGWAISNSDQFPYFVVIDRRNIPKLEIFPFDSYSSIRNNYGVAMCDYFGLRPLVADFNINLFREFFNGNVGKQIVALSFQGATKIKAKLKSLLVPKFFMQQIQMPEHLWNSMELMSYNKDQILDSHPKELIQEYKKLEMFMDPLMNKYPTSFMTLLVHFKNNLELTLSDLNTDGDQVTNYANPMILTPLLEAPKKCIYPQNEDVFTEFKMNCREQLSLELEAVQIKRDPRDNQLAIVSLIHNSEVLVNLYCDYHLGHFIQFLMNKMKGIPIGQAIISTQVPSGSQMAKIIEPYGKWQSILNELLLSNQSKINKLVIDQIYS